MQVSYCGSLQVGSGFWDNIIPFAHFVFMELFMSPQIINILLLPHVRSPAQPVCVWSSQGEIPNRHLAPTTELAGLVLKLSEAKFIPAYNFHFFLFSFIFQMVPLVQLLVHGNHQIQPQQSISI